MDERDFELLEKLYETKNITHTAEAFYITQPALSKRIAQIESELDVTLIIRSRQGVRFTPEGEEVLASCRKAAAELSAMRERLALTKDYVCGTLNAGISINYSQYRLPSVLASYRKKYPHVKTHVTSGHSRHLYMQLLEGQIDVAILRGEFDWKEHRVLIERENVCVIMNREYEGCDMNSVPYIGRSSDVSFERELAQYLRENQISVSENGIFVDNISTCVEMVKSGLGWSVVPGICLDGFDGVIRPLRFANGEPFVRSTYLLYSDNALQLPQVKAFIDLVQEYHEK